MEERMKKRETTEAQTGVKKASRMDRRIIVGILSRQALARVSSGQTDSG